MSESVVWGHNSAYAPILVSKEREKEGCALSLRTKDGEVKFKIVGDGYGEMPDSFDPTKGTISRCCGVVCPLLWWNRGGKVDASIISRKEKQESGLIAVVTHKPGTRGKRYRVATDADLAAFREAEVYLAEKRELLTLAWGMDAVPDEPTATRERYRGAERAFSGRKAMGY